MGSRTAAGENATCKKEFSALFKIKLFLGRLTIGNWNNSSIALAFWTAHKKITGLGIIKIGV
jgi:hypothetical protein